MSEPLFSVALITKQEAKSLPGLLASLAEFKARNGEVVILDTGSTDDTVKIAREWGCKVTEVGTKHLHEIDSELAKAVNEKFLVEGEPPIVNAGDKYFDFASARNESASYSKNKWVCYADADEAFTRLDIDAINEILLNQDLNNLEYQFIFAHSPDGSPAIQFIQSKFYNKEKLCWTNIVHEVLQPIV